MISPSAGLVDALLALVGRQRDRRLIERLARDHVVAAGEVLAVAAQVDAREDHLRAGRADVDADADQRHMVLQPDRVLLERAVLVELEMVVVVVGILVVLVDDVLAVEMVGEVVPPLWFLVLGIGHLVSLLSGSQPFIGAPGRRPDSCRTPHSARASIVGGRRHGSVGSTVRDLPIRKSFQRDRVEPRPFETISFHP